MDSSSPENMRSRGGCDPQDAFKPHRELGNLSAALLNIIYQPSNHRASKYLASDDQSYSAIVQCLLDVKVSWLRCQRRTSALSINVKSSSPAERRAKEKQSSVNDINSPGLIYLMLQQLQTLEKPPLLFPVVHSNLNRGRSYQQKLPDWLNHF